MRTGGAAARTATEGVPPCSRETRPGPGHERSVRSS
ncbi:hypothetical protein GZL_05346 [Streptomyces sp. 769]|nr:hypothetical protein GZL_05346 [Streptomyces sp. 769]